MPGAMPAGDNSVENRRVRASRAPRSLGKARPTHRASASARVAFIRDSGLRRSKFRPRIQVIWRAREVSNLSWWSWDPTPTTRAGDPRLFLGSQADRRRANGAPARI